MKNSCGFIEGRWLSFALALCILFVVSLSSSFKLPEGILVDPFHYGEYFALLTSLFGAQSSINPLTIHGALDYVPGLVAQKIFGGNDYFFPTWLIYRLLDFVAAIFLLTIVFQMVKNNPQRFIILLGVAIVAPFLVEYRDVALLLGIILYFLIQEKHNPVINLVLEISFGLVVALGLFWSFDRGIAGMVALGAASIIYAYQKRQYIISLFVFIVSVVTFGFFSPELSLSNYLENVKFLVATSSNWSYGWNEDTVILTALLGLTNILANWLLWSSIVKSKTIGEHSANALFLSILSLIFFKIGINRADTIHILWGLWSPMLMCIYWFSSKHEEKLGNYLIVALNIALYSILVIGITFRLVALAPIFTLGILGMISVLIKDASKLVRNFVAATLLLPIAYTIYLFSYGVAMGDYRWINYYHSLPSNSAMATDGVRWVSQELTNSGSHCVFDLSNNGVINGLTGLPACTRFTYLVYADQRYEDEIIRSVRGRKPKAIVYSSTFWSFSIDRKPMPARFPILNKYLLENYPQEKCSYGYCVRYLGVTE
jgi:hypothetical protein